MTNITDFTERRQFRRREEVPRFEIPIGTTVHIKIGEPGAEYDSTERIAELNAVATHIRAKLWGCFVIGLILGTVLGWFARGYHLSHP